MQTSHEKENGMDTRVILGYPYTYILVLSLYISSHSAYRGLLKPYMSGAYGEDLGTDHIRLHQDEHVRPPITRSL